MKNFKLFIAFILGFVALFVFQGCYTQFSPPRESGDSDYETYYEDEYDNEEPVYNDDSGYYAGVSDYQSEEGYYGEENTDPVVVERYYFYEDPAYSYYAPIFYDPYPVPGPYVSIQFSFGYNHWYQPRYGWRPWHHNYAYYAPFYYPPHFYWQYWDPWFAVINYPSPYYYPPYFAYYPPYCDPWYYSDPYYYNDPYSDPYGGERRDWGRRGSNPATHSGSSGRRGIAGNDNANDNNPRPPRQATIRPAVSTPSPVSVERTRDTSRDRIETVRRREAEPKMKVAERREPVENGGIREVEKKQPRKEYREFLEATGRTDNRVDHVYPVRKNSSIQPVRSEDKAKISPQSKPAPATSNDRESNRTSPWSTYRSGSSSSDNSNNSNRPESYSNSKSGNTSSFYKSRPSSSSSSGNNSNSYRSSSGRNTSKSNRNSYRSSSSRNTSKSNSSSYRSSSSRSSSGSSGRSVRSSSGRSSSSSKATSSSSRSSSKSSNSRGKRR